MYVENNDSSWIMSVINFIYFAIVIYLVFVLISIPEKLDELSAQISETSIKNRH